MAINSSLHFQEYSCVFSETISILSSILVLHILTIPLFVFVLVVGFQRWRKQLFSSHFKRSTHINILTYNVVILDLLGISGTNIMFFGPHTDNLGIWSAGSAMLGIFSTGHMLFHLLTCIERYLAVVHPILYLRLRGSAGVRIRNITIACVWLTSVGVMTLAVWLRVSFLTLSLVLLSFTSVAFCFCSISVLCAVIRPGPGEGGRNNRRSNQLKQRALRPMVIITGTLSLRFIGSLIVSLIQTLSIPYGYVFCVMGWSSLWFHAPSSLVLPLLFLQREGKLKVCGQKPDATA